MTVSTDHIHHLHQRIPGESAADELFALWIPSERVTFHTIPAPTAPERKWPELIPWMLEDRILQPVEEMHFVVCGQVDDQIEVVAVNRKDLQQWLEIVEQAGVTAHAFAPDFLALPWESGRICVAWRDGLCLVRSGLSSGFAAEPEMAWNMISQLMSREETEPRLSISVPDEALVPESLREKADINTAPLDWHLSEVPAHVNLLAGEFKPKLKKVNLRDWVPAAGLAVLVMVLFISNLVISNRVIEEEITALDQQVSDGFRQLFPGVRQTSDSARESAEETMSQLFRQKESIQAPSMVLLSALDEIISQCECDVHEVKVSHSGGELKLSNTKRLQSKGIEIPGFDVVSEVSAGGDRVTLVISGGVL